MTDYLDKAREQATAGQYKKAVDSLWMAENGIQVDLDEAQAFLALASSVRDQTDGGLRRQCEELVEAANGFIEALTATPAGALAADALAVVQACRVLGGHGLPTQPGELLTLIFRSGELLLVRGQPIAEVPYSDISALEIGGPGAQRRGGGFFGGGFGVAGATEGMLVASALNLLTTRTTTNTVLCLKTKTAELFLHTSTETPDALRMRLSAVFTTLRQLESQPPSGQVAGSGDAVDRLAKLADLLEKNLITREEFDRMKGDLLGTV
jgi:hypothetical protein